MEYWEDLFQPHILARGVSYYEMGAVRNLQKTANGYLAIVEGTKEYEVEIVMYGEEVAEMYCTCPYAEDGNHCKHMAAVLCEVEESDLSESALMAEGKRDLQSQGNKLKEMLEQIPAEELRQIVETWACRDRKFYDQLMMKYGQIGKWQIQEWKNEIELIGEEYSDRSGFVDWYHAEEYADALQAFLDQNVSLLLERKYFMETFEMVNAVFLEIVSQDVDDSEGVVGSVAIECYEYWKKILENCSSEEKETMFQWFLKYQGQDEMGYIEDFLVEEFDDPKILIKKMRQLDEQIEKAEGSDLSGSDFSMHYGEVSNIRARINIMERLGYKRNEILEYRKRYREFAEIRQMEVEEYLEEKAYDKAISVLEESKEKDRENETLVRKHSEQLIRIYEHIEDLENEKNELLFFVLQCRQWNLVYIKKLKAVSEIKEWEEYREKILKEPKACAVWLDLLADEQMFDQLLKKIQKEGTIFILNEYEKVLKKRFPEQVRDLYISYVENGMANVSDRKNYREWIKYLKKISKYPEGEEIAQKIAREWKEQYRRRSALLDELEKAGF